MICPRCERYLEDGVAFCIYCGERLGKYASTGNTGEVPTVAPGEASSASGDVAPVAPEPASDALRGAHAAPAAAAGGAAGGAAARAAAGTETAQAQETAASRISSRGGAREASTRLHSDDALSQRMDEIPEEPQGGKGRKILGGVILGALVAAAVGFGAAYVLPDVLNEANGGGSSSSSAVVGSSSSSSDSKSSSSSSSSKSSKSSKSSDSSSSVETKRGATLSKANGADAEGSSDGADANADAQTDASGPTSGPETTTGLVNTYGTGSGSGSGGTFSSATATATSISPTEGSVTHGPDLVLDGVASTAWNTNENGVGESITISADASGTVSGLRIMNGYNKISSSGADLYYANARAKDILIEYEGGSMEYTLKDLKGEYQEISIDPPVSTSWVKITIKSVYPGNAYDDCCISEIEII